MAKIITIEIDQATGDQTVDLTGYHGKGCDAVAEAFGNAIGQTVKVTHKGEFNKPAQHKNTLRQ
jgi:hypothetical protein